MHHSENKSGGQVIVEMALWAPFVALACWGLAFGSAVVYSKWALDVENLYLFRAKLYKNLGPDDCQASHHFVNLFGLQRIHECEGDTIQSRLECLGSALVRIESASI
jgi:hypothetical protein